MKKLLLTIFTMLVLVTGCSSGTYDKITARQAKRLMDEESEYIIIDVRTQEEYDNGHIPNAICIPNETIDESITDILKDKTQLLLVYCRSGNRSKQASNKLVKLGYTNIKEFGGITSWPYEIVK